MAKFDLNNLPKSVRIKVISEFYDIVSSLKKREEIALFLGDLLSPDEIAMLHRRVQVAIMLKQGYTFDEIINKLRVGQSKITKVKESLDRHGEGYQLAIRRSKKIYKKHQFSSSKKYPSTSLIWKLMDEINKTKTKAKKKKSD